MARVKVYDTATQSWVYADKSFGKDGKNPVRGVDYWTEEDQKKIIQQVIKELPVYNGEVV